jgi:hypothetical protein
VTEKDEKQSVFKPYPVGESPLERSTIATPNTTSFNKNSISKRILCPEDAIGFPVIIFEDLIEEEEIRMVLADHYGHGETAVP